MTSDRLDDVETVSRLFPKVRSWFALGAPLELLSPLSVVRIIAIVAALTWPVGVLTGSWPLVPAMALVACSIALVVHLMGRRVIAHPEDSFVLGGIVAMVLASQVVGSGEYRAVVVAALAATLALHVGLFVRGVALLPILVGGSAVFATTVGVSHGAAGFVNAVVMSVFVVLLGAMTAMTVRTARMSGAIDPDTGLPNARGMVERLRRRDPAFDAVVATVHLSGVSQVRDALGHHASGELVCRAVEDLGQVLPTGAVIGRGADDDVLVLVENSSPARVPTHLVAAQVVERIHAAIGTGRYLVGEVEVVLNTHVGIAIAPATVDDVESPGSATPMEVLRQAALAARTARDRGKLVANWDGESTTLTADDLELLASLRTAPERGELWVAYQPQVRTPDGRIVAVEALVRWSSEVHGFVSPGRFIPLAERTGFVDRLTEWVLDAALDAQARWVDEGFDVTVSVNVSPLSLRSVDFGRRVVAALDERDLEPHRLMLEVTESVAFDIPDAVERLGPLRARGIRVSIDDFGTGYTSLAVLPQLPLDELKVDQQFVREALTDPASEAIVRSVCELAHRLGLHAVAEGVEDEALAHLMTVFGYDLLQGYYFSKPLTEDDLLDRLRAQDDFSGAGAGDGAGDERASHDAAIG